MLVSTGFKVLEFVASAFSQVDTVNRELSRMNRIMVCGGAFNPKKQGFFSKIKNCLFNGLFYSIK
jgi:hypothetical protein